MAISIIDPSHILFIICHRRIKCCNQVLSSFAPPNLSCQRQPCSHIRLNLCCHSQKIVILNVHNNTKNKTLTTCYNLGSHYFLLTVQRGHLGRFYQGFWKPVLLLNFRKWTMWCERLSLGSSKWVEPLTIIQHGSSRISEKVCINPFNLAFLYIGQLCSHIQQQMPAPTFCSSFFHLFYKQGKLNFLQ